MTMELADPPYKDRPRRRTADKADVGFRGTLCCLMFYLTARTIIIGNPWTVWVFPAVITLALMYFTFMTLDSVLKWRAWNKTKKEDSATHRWRDVQDEHPDEDLDVEATQPMWRDPAAG